MSFTREQFILAVCSALGNIGPSDATINFGVGWTIHETVTNQGASYNLLNTTWDLEIPGQTNFNSVGVRNYPTFSDGITATVRTLQNGYYPTILKLLLSNIPKITDSPSQAMMAELSKWCGGCGYGQGFVTLGSQHRGDSFEYGNAPQQERNTMPTAHQIQAATDCWNSVMKELTTGTAPTGTGIYGSWLEALITGSQYGPPISKEYDSIDWNGTRITVQEFAHARCEWNGAPNWYGVTGKLN